MRRGEVREERSSAPRQTWYFLLVASRKAKAGPHLSRDAPLVVGALPVLGDVEAVDFGFFVNPQADQ